MPHNSNNSNTTQPTSTIFDFCLVRQFFLLKVRSGPPKTKFWELPEQYFTCWIPLLSPNQQRQNTHWRIT